MHKVNPIYHVSYTGKPILHCLEKSVSGHLLPPSSYVYDYTYYFDWLEQKENKIAECTISNHSSLLLTNKALCVQTHHQSWGARLKILPLNKVNNIEIDFQRLIFPLIIGGIVAPLALVAAFLNMTHFWISIAMSMLGLALVYYGWAGTYQLKITVFQAQQITYFVDFKTQKLAYFINKTQKLLLLRQTMVNDNL
jgi:hypothetical protein